MSGKRRVLVLDGDQASTYAIVRSLFRHGLEVHVADCRNEPLAGLSRYASKVLRYPAPKQDPEGFCAWLKAELKNGAYAYVIPVTDDTLQPIVGDREELSALCPIAMAPQKAHEICTDKAATFDVAEQLNIDVPGRLVVKNLAECPKSPFPFPVVVKPSRSVVEDAGQGRTSLSVRYAHDEVELNKLLKENLKYGPVILQEFAKGVGTGVEVLVDQGEVVAAFQHERLHEWPLTGGGSSYRESVALDAPMLDAAKKLMSTIGYHGVAMVEFKFDKVRNKRWLMEINGRFWGSLPLCFHAGADFPKWLFDLDVDQKRPTNPGYTVGIRSRKFSRDLFWAIEVLRQTDPNPLIAWPPRHQGLTTWFGVLLPKHKLDVQNWKDRKPGVEDFKRSIRLLRARMSERKKKLAILRDMRSLREDRIELGRKLNDARHLVYLCYGNINRSALAEIDLHDRLGQDHRITIESAGFHEKIGRPADSNMVEQAEKVGLSLANSQSSRIDQAMIDRADIILAMDVTHVLQIGREFPDALEKTILHAACNSDQESDIEITDPYGSAPVVYEACLERVRAANEGLMEILSPIRKG